MPLWLSPTQVNILTITDRSNPWAQELAQTLRQAGLRVHIDNRNEKIGYKIREAQADKVPYMVILGDKEVEEKKISIRHLKGEQRELIDVDPFITQLLHDIETKKIDI